LQGRLDEVSDLLAPYAGRFEVCEQLARLHLLREEPDLAAAVLNRALHDLVGDRLRAGRLLELLVEVELSRDHPDGASWRSSGWRPVRWRPRVRCFEPR
jgi:hypothetical protein